MAGWKRSPPSRQIRAKVMKRDEFSFCGEMLCLERDDKSEAEISRTPPPRVGLRRVTFRCVTGGCLLGESNNGQLLAKGGKHIRPQDRGFPMNTEIGSSKKMRRGAEKRLHLTFERVHADSRGSRGPYGPLGNSERRRRAGIVCTRQRRQPLRFLIDPGELSTGFGTGENFVPFV